MVKILILQQDLDFIVQVWKTKSLSIVPKPEWLPYILHISLTFTVMGSLKAIFEIRNFSTPPLNN